MLDDDDGDSSRSLPRSQWPTAVPQRAAHRRCGSSSLRQLSYAAAMILVGLEICCYNYNASVASSSLFIHSISSTNKRLVTAAKKDNSAIAPCYTNIIENDLEATLTKSHSTVSTEADIVESATERKAENTRDKGGKQESWRRKSIEEEYLQLSALKVSAPVFVLSLSKSGTTSMHKYFQCGLGPSSSIHWLDNRGKLVGPCLARNNMLGRPLLENCGNYTVWTDMNAIWRREEVASITKKRKKFECFFAGIHALDNIATNYPNATIVLTTRDAVKWADSAGSWHCWGGNGKGCLRDRMANFCDGFPNSTILRSDSADAVPAADRIWSDFYDSYVNAIRGFAKDHPSLNYIETSLEAETNVTALILEDATGIPGSCWGHANMRPSTSRNSQDNVDVNSRHPR